MKYVWNVLEKLTTTARDKEFTIKIHDIMCDKIIEFQRKTENLYNLEITPTEGSSFQLIRKDKACFEAQILAAKMVAQWRCSILHKLDTRTS